MNTEASLICDSATDYNGKLCVLGAFDTIGALQAPFVHPHSAVAIRLRFERAEEGKHSFRLMLIDQDGRPHGPRMDGEVDVKFPSERDTLAVNLILGMNNLPFPSYGTYHFDFSIDGSLKARVPLYIVPAQQVRKAA